MNEPARDHQSSPSRGALTEATAILAYLALIKILLHLLTADNYGYFRDELYYIAAGERLDLGYVDFPPFVALVARFTRALLGDSLVALHVFPALAGAAVVVLAVSGIAIAPLTVVPVLPVETLARITGAAGGDAGVQIETRKVAQLPQNFADRFGWKNMTATVAGVYKGLPADKRSEACILTGNYGEAGAIDFFGPADGLPNAISGHNSYYVWGPGDCMGEVIISLGVPRDLLGEEFRKIGQRATIRCEYCMPDENVLPVYLNQDPRMSLREAWPKFKHYD